MYKRSIVLITAVLSIAAATTADAQHRHRHHKSGRIDHAAIACAHRGCTDRTAAVRARVSRFADANGNGVILGGRPAGCPHSFCGCEASRYVFGEIRPELNLASNWIRKFPRAAPAPGMAAARSGHVMILISHVGGSNWLVHDGNSGGGLTRRHVRSINGHVIVDPHGSRSARQ